MKCQNILCPHMTHSLCRSTTHSLCRRYRLSRLCSRCEQYLLHSLEKQYLLHSLEKWYLLHGELSRVLLTLYRTLYLLHRYYSLSFYCIDATHSLSTAQSRLFTFRDYAVDTTHIYCIVEISAQPPYTTMILRTLYLLHGYYSLSFYCMDTTHSLSTAQILLTLFLLHSLDKCRVMHLSRPLIDHASMLEKQYLLHERILLIL